MAAGGVELPELAEVFNGADQAGSGGRSPVIVVPVDAFEFECEGVNQVVIEGLYRCDRFVIVCKAVAEWRRVRYAVARADGRGQRKQAGLHGRSGSLSLAVNESLTRELSGDQRRVEERSASSSTVARRVLA